MVTTSLLHQLADDVGGFDARGGREALDRDRFFHFDGQRTQGAALVPCLGHVAR